MNSIVAIIINVVRRHDQIELMSSDCGRLSKATEIHLAYYVHNGVDGDARNRTISDSEIEIRYFKTRYSATFRNFLTAFNMHSDLQYSDYSRIKGIIPY